MNQFEANSKMRRPESYREYAKLFGAGELFEFYRVAVPIGIDVYWDLEHYNTAQHGPPDDPRWDGHAPRQIIARMLFFAETIGGENFAWNTSEPNPDSPFDYSVYWFGRLEPVIDFFAENPAVFERLTAGNTLRATKTRENPEDKSITGSKQNGAGSEIVH